MEQQQQPDPFDGLRDPIDMEPLQDPVTVPCCGQTFSRQSLIDSLESRDNKCSLCNALLDPNGDVPFDAETAARNVVIADMVETIQHRQKVAALGKKADSKGESKSAVGLEQEWTAQLLRLPLSDAPSTPGAPGAGAGAASAGAARDKPGQKCVGQLKFVCKKPAQSLLVVVMDKSGSMGSKPSDKHIAPITHVKFSLQQILNVAYTQPELLTKIVSYNDKATTTDIDIVRKPMKHYVDIVNAIEADGGTTFQAAFDQLTNLAREYKDNDDVLSMTVVFLTDGEDSHATTPEARATLVKNFAEALKAQWRKQFTMHTIGFGDKHDEAFLNKLRCVGTNEGAYRYADPTHDTDSLSSKLNSLLAVIKRTPGQVLQLATGTCPYPILSAQTNAYWLDLSRKGDSKSASLHVESDGGGGDIKSSKESAGGAEGPSEAFFVSTGNNGQVFRLHAQVIEASRLQLEQWYSHLIDEVAKEMSEVAAALNPKDIIKQQQPRLESKSGAMSPADDQHDAKLVLRLHCELLHQRIRGIMPKLSADSANMSRLEELAETLQALRQGQQVNQLRLSDMQFEGQFATKRSGGGGGASPGSGAEHKGERKGDAKSGAAASAGAGVVYSWPGSLIRATPSSSFASRGGKDWNPIGFRYALTGLNDSVVWKMLCCSSNEAIAKWLASDEDSAKNWLRDISDGNGGNLLMVASALGRVVVVKMLLESLGDQAAQRDIGTKRTIAIGSSLVANALDVAILAGMARTAHTLFAAGIRPLLPGDRLLYTCLSRGYTDTASELLTNKAVVLDPSMLDSMPAGNHACYEWLSKRIDGNVSLETAILKGLVDVVATHLGAGGGADGGGDDSKRSSRAAVKPFSCLPYWRALFIDPSRDHVRIVEMLLERKLIDIDEAFPLSDETTDESTSAAADTKRTETKSSSSSATTVVSMSLTSSAPVPVRPPGFTWPLFAICERGNRETGLSMVKLLIKHGANLSKRNHKGTSAVWIAACNRHVDILGTLIEAGGDPNLANIKGDAPLIPACHKGSEQIASLLLDAGARLDVFNPERDSAVMICCRTGQHRILDQLLTRCESAELKNQHLRWCAKIDGFNPLLACAEVEKVECMRVCLKHGAEIDFRTAVDNEILPGANALHLACWYGRLHSLRALVSLGGDLKSVTVGEQLTPLHLAVKKGHAALVRFILGTRAGKESVSMPDKQGRLAKHFASMASNSAILDEFFSNTLGLVLTKVLAADAKTQTACAHALVKHGRSFGCFEYDDIAATEVAATSAGGSETLVVQAVMSNCVPIVKALVSHDQMALDVNQPDARSCIPPAFWAHATHATLGGGGGGGGGGSTMGASAAGAAGSAVSAGRGIVSLLPRASPLVEAMVARLQTVAKQSLQNKFLLTSIAIGGGAAAGGSSRALELAHQQQQQPPPAVTALSKMAEGYQVAVKADLVKFLSAPSQLTESHMLLGFLGGLKKSKQSATIESILSDARIHLIKNIVLSDVSTATDAQQQQQQQQALAAQVQDLPLEPAHMLALYLFSGTAYFHQQVNAVLARWTAENAWHPFVLTLYQAVSRLPSVTTEVYRAVDIRFDPKALAIGTRVKWCAFSTCSLEWQHATELLSKKRGVIFVVRPCASASTEETKDLAAVKWSGASRSKGHVLGRYARNSVDAEVVFLPGTEFEVVAYYRPNVIALGQPNIRAKSYPAFARHMDRAVAGTGCLIVELREL